MHSNGSRVDRRLTILLLGMAGATALLLALIMLFLLSEAWSFFANRWMDGSWLQLFYSQNWYPLEGQFGMAPMILSSLAVTVGAVALALPLGLGSAIFLQFYASPRSAQSFRLLLNVLAGIPSVVFGLWGLTRLVPLITSWQPPGASMLAAIVVLTLMILPTIALTSASSLASVPRELLAGSTALGLRRNTQILYIILPAARAGISSGVLLATARALGETLAVLMVAGNVVQNPSGLFEPVRVLTANIALEMAYAMGDHRASLFASGLLLTVLVWLLSWFAHHVSRANKQERQHG
ncbi:MAG: phosphate ABC transporter permease subunit PstC [Porticoccus sp.]|nr:phosphate ABC transporter permease subunit PstC [Porticoccus sp.]